MSRVEQERWLNQSVEIKKIKPSQLTLEGLQTMGLVELVTKGYGFDGTPLHLVGLAIDEYDGQEERTNSYIAILNGKAVASLAIRNWSTEDKTVGKYIWEKLAIRDEAIYNKAINYSTAASKIAGIITHPNFRNRKLGKKLYQSMVDDLKPAFIYGILKLPKQL